MTIDRISEFMVQVAEAEIRPRFKNLNQKDITEKSPGDMVSIADIEAEKVLTALLKNLFPDAVVAGEETIAQRPALLDAVISANHAFLLDPVDGTNNFIKGDDRFALMLTELRKGEAVVAWIYLPVWNKMAVAEKGSGGYINGRKIQLSRQNFQPDQMIGAAHINRFPENLRSVARKNLKKFRQNSPAFCAGYDYVALIEGEKDFSAYYRTLPWDHMPGSLIFAEAGGYVRTLFPEKIYSIQDRDKGLLSATDPDQWHKIREMVFPGFY